MNKKPNSTKPDPEEEKKRQERVRHQMNFSLSYLVIGLIGLWLFPAICIDAPGGS